MKAENKIGPPSIVEKHERPYWGIRFETPFAGMFAVVTKALKQMRIWAKDNQLCNQGPYFLRYYRTDMKGMMDVEVGLMTGSGIAADGPIAAHGQIEKGSLPRGRYATLTYQGNGLRGNQALLTWTKNRGIALDHLVADDEESFTSRYEAYLTDYRIEPRKLLWEVELSIKIAD